MSYEKIQGLLKLLSVIDSEHPKDFVDQVCEARDALPPDTENWLTALLHDHTQAVRQESEVCAKICDAAKEKSRHHFFAHNAIVDNAWAEKIIDKNRDLELMCGFMRDSLMNIALQLPPVDLPTLRSRALEAFNKTEKWTSDFTKSVDDSSTFSCQQQGFAVISALGKGLLAPYVHSFHQSEPEAQIRLTELLSLLPTPLTIGLSVKPAELAVELGCNPTIQQETAGQSPGC